MTFQPIPVCAQLSVHEIVRSPSDNLVILGTVGPQVGDDFWIRGVGGADRIVGFRRPR